MAKDVPGAPFELIQAKKLTDFFSLTNSSLDPVIGLLLSPAPPNGECSICYHIITLLFGWNQADQLRIMIQLRGGSHIRYAHVCDIRLYYQKKQVAEIYISKPTNEEDRWKDL